MTSNGVGAASSASTIRKKLRWHDSCDLEQTSSLEDDTVVSITDNRTGQMTINKGRKFVSCALCPKCFVHLGDLQQHHERYHSVEEHSTAAEREFYRSFGSLVNKPNPSSRQNAATSSQRATSFERGLNLSTHFDTPEESLDGGASSTDSSADRGWDGVGSSSSGQNYPSLSRSRSTSTANRGSNGRYQQRQRHHSAGRSSNFSGTANRSRAVPETPSPRLYQRSSSLNRQQQQQEQQRSRNDDYAEIRRVPQMGYQQQHYQKHHQQQQQQQQQQPPQNLPAYSYRCHVCLELFPTNHALKMHKTLADHHDYDCVARDKQYRSNAKTIPQSHASQAIQSHLESFLAQKKQSQHCHINVRVVSATKQSMELSRFVQDLFGLPSPYIECQTKTFFMFERFGNVDVIVFALFVQEFTDDDEAPLANRRRAFVSNFGAPGFLQGLNDELHSELFCNFLLAYLNYASSQGFEQVYFSSKMMAGNNDNQQQQVDDNDQQHLFPSIFNCQNAIKFRSEWLISVFNDAKTSQQLSYVGNFRTLADYRTYCKDIEEAERRFPLFVFDDNDENEDDFSARIEASAVKLLRKHRREWMMLDQSASRDIASRSMADVLMYELLGGHRFIVVNLQQPNNRQYVTPKALMRQDEIQLRRSPRFLSSPRRFLEKCKRKCWRFDTLNQASLSTAAIVGKMTRQSDD